MMTNKEPTTRPWHKEPWPWILFGIPAVSVVVGLLFLFTAITHQEGLVVDDYYRKGKTINLELKRDKFAYAIGLSAQVMLSDDGRQVRVITTSQQPLTGKLLLNIIHPTNSVHDTLLRLQQIASNHYQGTLRQALVSADHWYIQLYDEQNQWKLQGTWKPEDGLGISLQSHH